MVLSQADLGDSTVNQEKLKIPARVNDVYDEMVGWRRWFHQNAELSFLEFNTASKIVEILKEIGITDIWENIGKTGVVGMIHGKAGDGPCVMLRADMDALPILESADIDYKSQNEGCMHACGHDGHVSALLGAAKVLYNQRDRMKGSVKLCFQPAEEGKNGAGAMITDGVLEMGKCGNKVDFVYGIHLWSYAKLGTIECSHGPVMAASDKFVIEVNGKGGHGALPHVSTDAIMESATLITSLQTVVSRSKDPLEDGVLSCCKINGGFGYNIIADKVTIEGTCRSFTPSIQELMKSKMCQICDGVSVMYGGEINVDYQYGYPPTVNSHPEAIEVVRKATSKIVGEAYTCLPQKTMGAEDFSYFLQQVPGAFFFVGAALPGEARPHHKSVFDFDERALLISASSFVSIIDHILG